MEKNDIIIKGISEGFKDSNQRLNSYCKLDNKDLLNLEEHIDYNEKYDINLNSKEIKFYKTIINDINRTFNNKSIITKDLNSQSVINYRNKLEILLCNFFLKFKNRIYFQGFNSVAEILYLNYGVDTTYVLLNSISKIYFDKFMMKSTNDPMKDKITKLKRILENYKPKIHKIINKEYYN